MNFDLTEDQALFKASVQRFTEDCCPASRRAFHAHPGGVDRQRWAAMADLGLLALPADREVGGLDGNLIDCSVVAEALGFAIAAEPWLECGVLPLRLLGGSPAAAAVIDGSRLMAVAIFEPDRRFSITPVTTRATPHGGNYVLTGTKRFVLGGAAADSVIVSAMAPDGPALFLIDAARVRSRAYVVIDGSRAAELLLNGLEVSAESRLPYAPLDDAIAECRLLAAAEMVGLASRLFDDTLNYVRQREQFGQAIGRFQAIQHRLVDAYVMLELMRSALRRATMAERGSGPAWRAQIAGTKGFIAERAQHIGHEAVQMHGGMGMTDELAIGHAHKRVVLLARLFGDPAGDLDAFVQAA